MGTQAQGLEAAEHAEPTEAAPTSAKQEIAARPVQPTAKSMAHPGTVTGGWQGREELTGGELAWGGGEATGLGVDCAGDWGGGELCWGGLGLGLGCMCSRGS